MSKATKKKHVAKEVLDDYVVPDPNQQIVKVIMSLILSTLSNLEERGGGGGGGV